MSRPATESSVAVTAFSGMQVWVRREIEDDQVYDRGVVSSVSKDGTVKVKIGGKERLRVKQSELLLDDADNIEALQVSDVTQLSNCNEAAISDVIRRRFVANCIYTFARPLLMVVNPFCDLQVTKSADIVRFKQMDADLLSAEPHIFGLARQGVQVYLASGRQRNVSFVISGESGAGKTETTKHLMQYFAAGGGEGGREGASASKVQTAVMAGNPILEAFGNAKTVRNNNSSRFGRFMALYLQPSGGIEAGEVSSYLLEKSRISKPGAGERNFHIFYQMLRGLDEATKTSLRLGDVRDFRFLASSGCFDVEHKDDAAEFRETVESFQLIGLTQSQVDEVLRILAGVLHCGQLEFAKEEEEESTAQATDADLFNFVASDLLGLDAVALLKQLAVQTRRLPGGQVVESPVTAAQTKANLESLGRSAYAKLFEWLITVLNGTIRPDAQPGVNWTDRGWVGVLDLFGFEIFQENSLEQFLINFANEKLQQFFTEHVFQEEKKLYEREGIDASDVVFEDNQALLAVFESPVAKTGMLEHLESVSMLQSGTVEAFFSTVSKQNYDPRFFSVSAKQNKGTLRFVINHTAAPVVYDAQLFRDKNMDRVPADLALFISNSTNLVLKDAFAGAGGGSSKYTCAQFKESMSSLLTILRDSFPLFVRCVKPNQTKQQGLFVPRDVISQLHSLSIMEAINLAQKGFSYRKTFADFLGEFRLLRHLPNLGTCFEQENPQDGALAMLKAVVKRGEGMSYQDARFGETMLFLKKNGHQVVDGLKRKTAEDMRRIARCVKKHFHSAEAHAEMSYEVAQLVKVQSQVRAYVERKSLIKTDMQKKLFTGSLLLLRKAHRFLFDRKNGLVLQAMFRNVKAMMEYGKLVEKLRKQEAARVLMNHAETVAALVTLEGYREEMKLLSGCIMMQRATRNFLTKQAFRRNWIWRMIVWPAREKFQERSAKATRIQACWRGFHFRRTFPDRAKFEMSLRMARFRVLLEREVVPLQLALKSFVAMRKFELAKQAVALFEDRVINSVARERFSRIKSAAKKIQRFYRGWLIRQVVALHKAAVVFLAERARLAREDRRSVAPLVAKANLASFDEIVSSDKKRSLLLHVQLQRQFGFDLPQIVVDVLGGKFGGIVHTVRQTKTHICVFFSDTQKIVRVNVAKGGLVDGCMNPEIADTGSAILALETTDDKLFILVSSGRIYAWPNDKLTPDVMTVPKRTPISSIAARHQTLLMVDVDGRAHVLIKSKFQTIANLPSNAMRGFVTDEDAIVLLKTGSLFSLRTRSEIYPISVSKLRVTQIVQGRDCMVMLNGNVLYVWGRRPEISFPRGYLVGEKHGVALNGHISRPIRVCPSNMLKGGWLVEQVQVSDQMIYVRTHADDLFCWASETLYFDASGEALLDPHLAQSRFISKCVGSMCFSESAAISIAVVTADKSVPEIVKHRAAAVRRVQMVKVEKKLAAIGSRRPVVVAPVKKRFTAGSEKFPTTGPSRKVASVALPDRAPASLITYKYRNPN